MWSEMFSPQVMPTTSRLTTAKNHINSYKRVAGEDQLSLEKGVKNRKNKML